MHRSSCVPPSSTHPQALALDLPNLPIYDFKPIRNRHIDIPNAYIKPMTHDDPTDPSFKPHASFQELALDHEQIADSGDLLTWA